MKQEELTKKLAEWGEPPYRARQILTWIYQRGASTYQEMTDLPESLREQLSTEWAPLSSEVIEKSRSSDETSKLLLRLHDGELIETVIIREGDRRTACISTQVGCPVACIFCASGLDGVSRNLKPHEIVEQVLAVNRSLPKENKLTNVVVMGSGEPLLNADNLIEAIRNMNEPSLMGFGARRVTVSTVGLPDRIRRLADVGLQLNLAVSLHAPNDTLRKKIIPTARPIADILAATDVYQTKTGREVTFEYVLLKGVNDAPEHASELARTLGRRQCLINLIPQNPVPGVDLCAPDRAACELFQSILQNAGHRTTLRKTKGQSIDAACGQLRRRKQGSQSA